MSSSRPTDLAGIIRLCFSGGIPRRSLMVALVVGTILNLINQGDALLGDIPINWVQLTLTYMVPYCVSTYGAVSVLYARGMQDDGAD